MILEYLNLFLIIKCGYWLSIILYYIVSSYGFGLIGLNFSLVRDLDIW